MIGRRCAQFHVALVARAEVRFIPGQLGFQYGNFIERDESNISMILRNTKKTSKNNFIIDFGENMDVFFSQKKPYYQKWQI